MAGPQGRIGFLVKTWPKLSETFILEEVLGLERMGQELAIFALASGTDGMVHDALARVRSPVEQLGAGATAADHLRCLARAPLGYLRAAWCCAARPEAGRRRDFSRGVRLAAALARRGIAHLHAHFVSEPAAVAEIACALSGASYSLSAHAKDIYLSRPAVLRRKLDGARFTLTCTDYNRRHLAALAPHAVLRRMYHGIDLARFHPGLRRPVAGDPLILAVGRLREKKGFASLIAACALLVGAGRRLRCEIVGYGEEQGRLAAAISAAGLDGTVVLAGPLARHEVIARYARATLFVMPSQLAGNGDRDGIPNVLLEAMAMELPVVATAVSGIPELVQDGSNGLLVAGGGVPALAAAIARLLDDPALAARLGRAGRCSVAADFDNDRNLTTLRDALAGLAAAPAAATPVALAAGAAHGR